MRRERMREEMEEMLYRELRERRFFSSVFDWIIGGTLLLFLFAAIVGKLYAL
jgi:hypothetical protein